MPSTAADGTGTDPRTSAFYGHALALLSEADVPFLIGGAYALQRYTGIERHTKDLDLFLRPGDCPRALAVLRAAGYHAEIVSPHWLAKVRSREDFIDIIFNSGNGLAEVDDGWFAHAEPTELFGRTVQLCPAEETIWSKAFVMERERYDGADVAHILRARAATLDWQRLLRRFGEHWPVLLSHLVLFSYIYPRERTQVPGWVLDELVGRLRAGRGAERGESVCRGTLLSHRDYLVDVQERGYRDARLPPHGRLTAADIAHWLEGAR